MEMGFLSVTVGNSLKMQQRKFSLGIRKNFLTMRLVKQWNRIPTEIVESLSLKIFKRLNRHLARMTYSRTILPWSGGWTRTRWPREVPFSLTFLWSYDSISMSHKVVLLLNLLNKLLLNLGAKFSRYPFCMHTYYICFNTHMWCS